ncbi:PREDICTED: protein TIPIN homolog isoform X2 [Tarenaya hassleriana]|uniref:protein TIPIN homolog isoform X2 n=1 Tax=Tarenaya hassleriana TaxID=28532 RepID=UPI00053CA9E7|nr:PREDICTED: protein TIPIN homolog isoform X2 [Tarenaya hassleriana]
MASNVNSAPTGCFKCGRPGHWSRDCPSSAPNSGNPSSSSSQNPSNDLQKSSSSAVPKAKVPKTRTPRPKLTPDLLLSDDGLGYVLRYFPRSFKYRGRGREVSDLGNLIRSYSEWHSHLLPYYSFDQFVHKVQQVAATKRVKICVNELRERVASGVDPMKLYENPVEDTVPCDDQGNQDLDQPCHDPVNGPSDSVDPDSFQEVMLNEIYGNAMDDTRQASDGEADDNGEKPLSNGSNERTETAGMDEGNGLKGMERAQGITEEQKARMEANRLKALERAKARSMAPRV